MQAQLHKLHSGCRGPSQIRSPPHIHSRGACIQQRCGLQVHAKKQKGMAGMQDVDLPRDLFEDVARGLSTFPSGFSTEEHSKTVDVLGLAQAMVDFTASVPAELLSQAPFSVGKGNRRIITLQERHEVMEALDDHECESQISPGGSLANTLVGIARLASAHGSKLRVSMAGCVGHDTLGTYFNAQLGNAGVKVVHDQDNLAHTGTVMVLTTPDAQRSFLSFFDSGSLRMTPTMHKALTSARICIIEGYLLELPGASTWIPAAARLAKESGAQLVVTAGDPTVVSRHRSVLQSVIQDGLVDVLFCNKEEAMQLLEIEQDSEADEACTAQELTAALSQQVGIAVVTDGRKGSSLGMDGELFHVSPFWSPSGPVDVCGAGDAYAAGVLYGVMSGYDLLTAGQFASRVASAVISKHGAQLAEEDAEQVVKWLPDHVPLDSCWSDNDEEDESAISHAASVSIQ